MGVYVRGDIHGKFDEILSFRDKMQLNKQDSIIILGDAGICWRNDKKDIILKNGKNMKILLCYIL